MCPTKQCGLKFNFQKRKNVVCGIIYRQHNSPEKFQEYFDATVEKYSAFDKPIHIMGDLSLKAVDLQNNNFLLSLQSYALIYSCD